MKYYPDERFEDTYDDSILYIEIEDIRKNTGKLDVYVKLEDGDYRAEWNISSFEHGLKTKRYSKIEGLLG